MASAKGMSTGYRGKRVTKDRLAGMSSYEKAKNKTKAGVWASGIRKKYADRMGAEGPKKSSPSGGIGKSGGRGVAASKRTKKK